MNLSWSLLLTQFTLLIGILLGVVLVVHILLQRSTPQVTIAWLLAILLLPYIDVRIIVPSRSNHPLVDLVRGRYLRELQRAGARILLYEAGMMHAKLLLMDRDIAMMGSANMDIRSLFLDYEIAAFFYDESTIEMVEDWIAETMRACQEGVEEASVARSLFEAVTHIVAPVV